MEQILELAFGLFILVVVVVGLVNRRKQNRSWVAEERRDDSGYWIDKRAGERGTYGSLDAEREAERHTLTRQGRINDLALEIRQFAFENYPGFHERSDEQIRAFTAFARAQAAQIADAIDALKKGHAPQNSDSARASDPLVQALKKKILDFCYANFPGILEAELDLIRQFDAGIEGCSCALTEKMSAAI